MHLGQISARHVRFANGDPVDSCDKFKYLGVPTYLTQKRFFNLVYPRHGQPRLSIAQSSTLKRMTIKIGLCRSAVESILLFGLECLPLTLTLQNKLDSAYRRILRYALGVHFPDCISNAELMRRTEAMAMSNILRQRRLRLVGHALRMANPRP